VVNPIIKHPQSALEANAATKASLSKLAQSLGGWDGHEPVVLDSLEVGLWVGGQEFYDVSDVIFNHSWFMFFMFFFFNGNVRLFIVPLKNGN